MPEPALTAQRSDRTAVAAIGEASRIAGFTLAGVRAAAAEDPDAVRRTWDVLPDDVGVVILTPTAAAALESRLAANAAVADSAGRRLTVVLPDE